MAMVEPPVCPRICRTRTWRRDVEHHDVARMMGKNTGKIMPADWVRSCFDNRFNFAFGRSALLHHGACFDSSGLRLPFNRTGRLSTSGTSR
jgi:hypothetical protein